MKTIKALHDAELKGISAGMGKGTSNQGAIDRVCENVDNAIDKSNAHATPASEHNPNYSDCGGTTCSPECEADPFCVCGI